ncbi:MAG: 30S ribosomal protein S6 [Actinobacteria bacterium]|nr:30S ribosomal protein S6 [Actinomycetota bacterium]
MECAVRTYELVVVFRPEMAETEVRSEVSQVEKALVERGAEIRQVDFWGKRRLAYEIKHVSEGYYAVVAFSGGSPAVDDLDRALALSDNVLRHKFIRPE